MTKGSPFYLGGAVAARVRVGKPLFNHAPFGVYPGIIIWGGLRLRDFRLRAPIPPGDRRPKQGERQ